MEVIGESVLSAALQSLLGFLRSQELLKFARKQKVDEELKKWESKLKLIHEVLDDAQEKQFTNSAVKHWFAQLRDLACDVEDIRDEFHAEALKSNLKGEESEASTSAMKRLLPTCCAAPKPSGVWRNMKMASKLKGITARLEGILNDKKALDLVAITGGRSNIMNGRPPSTSLVDGTVYGRAKDKEAVMELMMRGESSNNSPYSVIPIVGMGGVGKTTLAQLIYNDEKLDFDCKAWVCVSDDFDIVKITKAVLQRWASYKSDDTFNVLQEKLKESLQGKRFLIVLDDVWSENNALWFDLRKPFRAGAPGSKIIVTTRNKGVSNMVASVPVHTLEVLSNDDCLSLFARHALDAENFDANPELKEIGQQIVSKCDGLPLAVKTLGGLLRGQQSVQEWERTRDNKIWEIGEEKSSILPALRLSYHYLPSDLKQCFCFCATFPKDYEFDKNELVFLWMAAEGFLQQRKERKQAKFLGYFNELLSRSFFQQSSGNSSRYVMHDLMHDLAQFVSEGVCFCLDEGLNAAESYNTNVRHSLLIGHTYDTWRRFQVFRETKKLRTLLVLPRHRYSTNYLVLDDLVTNLNYVINGVRHELTAAVFRGTKKLILPRDRYSGNYLSRKVLDDLVPNLKCLRALSLPRYEIEELPDSIGALKLLRYLNLSGNPIKKLPPSLTELINLQTLLLCECNELVELPVDIGNLISLQYLDISDTNSLQVMPPQMSRLKNLCSLFKFIVGEASGLAIAGLSKISPPNGQLLVKGLHNVPNAQDARRANLKEKQGLRELSLEWSNIFDGSRNERNELEVLNSLQPHQSVEKLSVTAYGGTVFPAWVGDPCFTKIVELKLLHCHKLTSVSSIWKLPVLKYLRIQGMNEVKKVEGEAIPALETLEITNMPEWEQWSWSLGHDEFCNLRNLTLRNCPKLNGAFPRCLPSLKELDVDGCQEVVLRSLGDLPSLTTLTIGNILGLESLQGTVPVQALVALEDLKVSSCEELKYLWKDGNGPNKLANLKKLDICGCGQLASLVEGEEGLLPRNLQVLGIYGCSNLEKMPNGLHSLTSLRELGITGSSKLVSFPEGAGLPYSLKRLRIGSCGSLESLPYGMMNTGHDSSNQCLLEELVINGCTSLKSFPEGKLPTKLKRLEIWDCRNLESLPRGITYTDPREMSHSNLEFLSIRSCSSLRSLPAGEFPPSLKTLQIRDLKIIQQLFPSTHSLSHLTDLTISHCHELKSLPVGVTPNLISLWIQSCEKLKSVANFIDELTSLQELSIWDCSSLLSFTASGLPPNLTSLIIMGCENLRQPMSEWGLHALTSLESFRIGFESPFCTTTDVDYFPDDCGLLLPTSIASLWIYSHENLKSISKGIQRLTSLRRLFIEDCPKLKFLPKEGFPATLDCLSLSGCPLLAERCKKDGGDYWTSIIAHIPSVDI